MRMQAVSRILRALVITLKVVTVPPLRVLDAIITRNVEQ